MVVAGEASGGGERVLRREGVPGGGEDEAAGGQDAEEVEGEGVKW